MNPERALERSLERSLETNVERQAQGGGAYTGPLDRVPGADWGPSYSFNRALTVDWLGQPLFRIKRDSDNDETNVVADAVTGEANFSAIMDWLDGATGTLVTVFDQSGLGADLSVSVGSLEFFWDGEYRNGKAEFFTLDSALLISDAYDITYSSGAFSGFSYATCLYEMDLTIEGDASYIQVQPAGGATLHINDDETRFAGAEINDKPEGLDPFLFDWAVRTGERAFFVNGASRTFAQIFDAGGDIQPIANMRVEISLQSGAELTDVVACDGYLSDVQRSPVRSDFATYYAQAIA